jgi:hypothetical protein
LDDFDFDLPPIEIHACCGGYLVKVFRPCEDDPDAFVFSKHVVTSIEGVNRLVATCLAGLDSMTSKEEQSIDKAVAANAPTAAKNAEAAKAPAPKRRKRTPKNEAQ